MMMTAPIAIAVAPAPEPEPVAVVVPPEVEEGSATEAVIVDATLQLTQQVTELTACVRTLESCVRNLELTSGAQQIELSAIRSDLNAMEAEEIIEPVAEIEPPPLPVAETKEPNRARGFLGTIFLGASS